MLFRFKALQKAREPDELDTVVQLASPRAWIAVSVILAVVIGAGIWAFAAALPRSVESNGLLASPFGVATVVSPFAGEVGEVLVQPEQPVVQGDPLVAVLDSAGTVRQIVAPFAGEVAAVAVSNGRTLAVGDIAITLERTDTSDDRIIAMLFVSSSRAATIKPGMPVDLSVSAAPSRTFGVLRGEVASVGRFLLTEEQVLNLVGNDLLARDLISDGAPLLVRVNLLKDSSTASGYAWSTASGPPFGLASQTAVTASVRTGEDRPIDLVFGN